MQKIKQKNLNLKTKIEDQKTEPKIFTLKTFIKNFRSKLQAKL